MSNKKHLEYLLHKRPIFNRWVRMGGRADLNGATLTGADLRGANLDYADLSGADLSQSNMFGSTLIRADLGEATLIGATLRQADLNGATLVGADLRQADLGEANLSGAYLGHADFSNTEVSCNYKTKYSVISIRDHTFVGCVRKPTSWWLDATEGDVADFAHDAREWWHEYGGMVKRICEEALRS